ncbi:MAG: gamma-glutamyl-gamma-aminobutyrate hydrolase family protein [Candidatus Eremiobacterota bacterium]
MQVPGVTPALANSSRPNAAAGRLYNDPTKNDPSDQATLTRTPEEAPPPPDQLETSARELEADWANRLGDQSGKTVVGISVTEAWVKDKFVYLEELAQGVLAAGGTPRLLFLSRGDAARQMQGLDALIIPGGGDVDPSFYGQVKGPAMADSNPDKAYDRFQIDLVQQAYREKMPLLGLCRGEQVMNVAGGGTLEQSIDAMPGQHLQHWNDEAFKNRPLRRFGTQEIRILQESALHRTLGALAATVNSIHRQCVGNLSPQLLVTAWAMDGIPEAVEVKGAPWQLGVQFHPEWLRLDQPQFQNFFDRLVADGQRFRAGDLTRPTPPPAVLSTVV